MKGNYSYAECPNNLLKTTYRFLSVRFREFFQLAALQQKVRNLNFPGELNCLEKQPRDKIKTRW